LRIAVFSDVHSNLPALEAVLAAAEEAEVDELWCLGDIVGYGAQPNGCAKLTRERCDACLVGNHDLAVLGELDISSFSDAAALAVAWTRAEASAETLDFLRGMKPAASREGVGMFHASPRDPVWEYVLSAEQAEGGLDAQEERLGLIGHSHIALYFTRPDVPRAGPVHGSQASEGALLNLDRGEWLVNPGSVGQPRDGDPRAAWLELDTEQWTARYHRVEYDVTSAAEAIVEAGLPGHLAKRLELGR
jgi:predicted phosphodiesterase